MSAAAAVAPRTPTTVQVAALAGTVVIGSTLGLWAYVWPVGFFERFPIVLGEWISRDGPFNEHLVRDHGAMYLALAAAGLYGLVQRGGAVMRALGVVWTVFGILHVAYHVSHLAHLSAVEATGQLTALVVALTLGVILLLPGREPRTV